MNENTDEFCCFLENRISDKSAQMIMMVLECMFQLSKIIMHADFVKLKNMYYLHKETLA